MKSKIKPTDRIHYAVCTECNGTGRIYHDKLFMAFEACPVCNGDKVVVKSITRMSKLNCNEWIEDAVIIK